MDIRRNLVLLVALSTFARPQSEARRNGEITFRALVQDVKYCLGPTGFFYTAGEAKTTDITLRLTLKLVYENHGSEPVIVPLRFKTQVRLVSSVEKEAENIFFREDPVDARAVVDLASPAPPYFILIRNGASEAGYLGEVIDIRVSSAEAELLGKTISLEVSRDHGLLPLAAVAQLERKWRGFGKLWTGISNSETVGVSIPSSPSTVDCRKGITF